MFSAVYVHTHPTQSTTPLVINSYHKQADLHYKLQNLYIKQNITIYY